jgi:hypothetical protein
MCREGSVIKGGVNPPNTSTARPPPPGGSLPRDHYMTRVWRDEVVDLPLPESTLSQDLPGTSHRTYHGLCGKCGNTLRARITTAAKGRVPSLTCPCGYMMEVYPGRMADRLETK